MGSVRAALLSPGPHAQPLGESCPGSGGQGRWCPLARTLRVVVAEEAPCWAWRMGLMRKREKGGGAARKRRRQRHPRRRRCSRQCRLSLPQQLLLCHRVGLRIRRATGALLAAAFACAQPWGCRGARLRIGEPNVPVVARCCLVQCFFWYSLLFARPGAGAHQRLPCRLPTSSACRVAYLDRSGARLAATVVGVDRTIQPHSYAVEIHSLRVVRETEAHRLEPAQVGRGGLGRCWGAAGARGAYGWTCTSCGCLLGLAGITLCTSSCA